MIYPENFENKIGFDTVRGILTSYCSTAPGREFTESMGFSADYHEICRRLDSTAEMLAIYTSPDPLPIHELDNSLATILGSVKIPGAGIEVADLMSVRALLVTITEIADFFKGRRQAESGESPYPTLDIVATGLPEVKSLLNSIDRTVDKYGNVRDNASAELADIRARLRQVSGTVNSILRRVMARAAAEGILEVDVTPAVRDGRLVVPVNPAMKRKLPGIVHDESASGKTVFIEPAEVVEANNSIRELEMEERREINRIMAALAALLRPEIDILLSAYSDIGLLDFIRAKARFANGTGGCRPHIEAHPQIEWYHACHPVLKLSLERQGKEIVPLDIVLSKGQRILVISGPNAGGKSVCLKTSGIVQYMTQCGMLPTVYDNSHFGIFDDIFIDIGDDQSIEDDLSTYSSHLRNMKLMLQKGHDTSLTLIDEFGGGTEPQIGGAIAQAILKQFNIKRMWGVITTHYQNLKHFAEDTDGLVNGSMLYDRHLMKPLFKLSVGNPGSSFAIEIARKTGLPSEVIDDATEIVGSDYVNLDKYLLDIARDKRYWENKRTAIRRREKDLEATLEKYRDDAETLRRSRREILDEAKREAQKIIDGSNSAVERAIHEIREAQAEREKTLEARRKLREQKTELSREASSDTRNKLLKKAPKAGNRQNRPQTPKPDVAPQPGDTVKLDGHGTPGRVLTVEGQNATVAFGQLKTTVKLSRLKKTNATLHSGAEKKASFISAATTDAMRERQLSFRQEIDVRGMRADEAVQAVTYFLDDAIQFNASRLRILHGTGTGALRQVIRQYLDTCPGVRHYADEDVRFGGAGITVVDLD